MRLQVKVNIPLDIRMCLECPFYSEQFLPTCLANKYINKGKEEGMSVLNWDDIDVIPSICPLLKLKGAEYENK